MLTIEDYAGPLSWSDKDMIKAKSILGYHDATEHELPYEIIIVDCDDLISMLLHQYFQITFFLLIQKNYYIILVIHYYNTNTLMLVLNKIHNWSYNLLGYRHNCFKTRWWKS